MYCLYIKEKIAGEDIDIGFKVSINPNNKKEVILIKLDKVCNIKEPLYGYALESKKKGEKIKINKI
jgi:hypothetical protein